MYKLYKNEAGRLRYHEAWDEDDCVIEHFGVVGLPGETRRHELEAGVDPDQLLESLLKPSALDGYEEIADEELVRLEVVIPPVDDDGVERRHALEDHLDDLLGETGLGHCDGGRTSGNEITAFCYVVDAEVAREVLLDDLPAAGFPVTAVR